ncbi:MAG: hypothetical protein FWD33_04105 [Alphaproteobacteria bacterium]|nr:hypothetical protein [Alphaproteobacteria bacterium]
MAFESIEEFVEKMEAGRKMLESLVKDRAETVFGGKGIAKEMVVNFKEGEEYVSFGRENFIEAQLYAVLCAHCQSEEPGFHGDCRYPLAKSESCAMIRERCDIKIR